MKEFTFLSNSPATTASLGKKIGERIEPGSLLALTGDLGCGKTLLTRGICQGLNIDLRLVNSPTFVLVNEYSGRLPVFHFDLYRLSDAPDVVELGFTDYLARAASGVMIIEWAEKILSVLPEDTLKIKFDVVADRKRRLEFSTSGHKYDTLFIGLVLK
jgi:tRNA threonylcarbamoyladenosine biosynthesis protein TsaE